jgi:hypothetical protein
MNRQIAKALFLLLLAFLFCLVLFAQGGSQSPLEQALGRNVEEGIPVSDPLVISKCSGCHQKDEKGNLSRISWERTTPEGWQAVIRRMVRLNGLTLTPEEGRAIVKSLSSSHGLAPEEAKPVMYMRSTGWLMRRIQLRRFDRRAHRVIRSAVPRRGDDPGRNGNSS